MNDTEDEQKLIESLVGRTITRARWFDASPDREWTHHETGWLWLDDGRVIEFGSWGHDADGATMDEIEVVEIDACLHCGAAHGVTRLRTGDELGPYGVRGSVKHAYCASDGTRIAYREMLSPVQ